MVPDEVLAGVVHAAAAEHEAVHAHAQVLALKLMTACMTAYMTAVTAYLGLETLPDEHAGPRHPGHLAWPRGDLVAV